ncbi:hypothetical protein LCGC14_2997970, partial [marine sediment metagenome]
MIRSALLTALLLTAITPGSAALVSERWGPANAPCTYPGTLKVATAGGGTKLTFDLSALPARTKVYRARFVPLTGEGFEMTAEVGGKPKRLPVVEPYELWLDATEGVRSAVSAGKKAVTFTLHRQWGFKADKCYLEIAYEGRVKDPPAQVAELKVLARAGQALLTWKEIWDIADGNAEIAWGEMVKKVTTCTPLGLQPKDTDREIRYRIYVHDEPITAGNISRARFVHEVRSGSGYIEERIARGKVGEQGPTYLKAKQALRRVVLTPPTPLPPGYGFYPHTVDRAGKAYYAVVTAVNGV